MLAPSPCSGLRCPSASRSCLVLLGPSVTVRKPVVKIKNNRNFIVFNKKSKNNSITIKYLVITTFINISFKDLNIVIVNVKSYGFIFSNEGHHTIKGCYTYNTCLVKKNSNVIITYFQDFFKLCLTCFKEKKIFKRHQSDLSEFCFSWCH